MEEKGARYEENVVALVVIKVIVVVVEKNVCKVFFN